jgi:predicted DNA-binding transcriptional regulator AlpA
MEKLSSYLDQREERHFPEKMNVQQASEFTGYSRLSLYQMHSKGTIPGALKVGGKLMFDTETLRDWVNNGGRR